MTAPNSSWKKMTGNAGDCNKIRDGETHVWLLATVFAKKSRRMEGRQRYNFLPCRCTHPAWTRKRMSSWSSSKTLRRPRQCSAERAKATTCRSTTYITCCRFPSEFIAFPLSPPHPPPPLCVFDCVLRACVSKSESASSLSRIEEGDRSLNLKRESSSNALWFFVCFHQEE